MYPDDLNGEAVDSEAAWASGGFADHGAQSLGSLPFHVVTSGDVASEASAPDVVVTPWPSHDNGPAPLMSPAHPISPFLGELARAMLAAADRERERIHADLVEEAAEQGNKVQVRATAETEEIERQARDDLDRIHDWAEAEIERIHQEEASRLDDRRKQLDDHLAQHAALIDAENARVESAVEEYRAQLDDFLGRLAMEPSPVEIARLAGTLPDSPNFEEIRASARAEAVAGLVDADVHAEVDPAAAATFSPPQAEDSYGADLVGVMAPSASEVGS